MLTECCCCIDLKTGALVIGYLNLVWTLFTGLIIWLYPLQIVGLIIGNSQMQFNYQYVETIAYTLIGIVAISLIFIVFLLLGIHKKIRGCITAFVVFNTICIVLDVIGFVFSFSTYLQIKAYHMIPARMIRIGLNIYFQTVIVSYRSKMKQNVAVPVVYATPSAPNPYIYNVQHTQYAA